MSKQRIIGCLILRDNIVVQSIGFERYLPVGRPEIAARFFDQWGVDEIVLLDITARREGRTIPIETVAKVSAAIHAPLTVGGGLRSVDDVRAVIQAGADKISINGLLHDDPAVVEAIAHSFGVQCVIASIDALRGPDDTLHCMTDGRRRDVGQGPVAVARAAANLGAGEILINAIHRDGAQTGFDLPLIQDVARAVEIPVIALGGAGRPENLAEVLTNTGVSAVAAANFLHYIEHAIAVVKSRMRSQGLDIRLDSEADYQHIAFDGNSRIGRRPDQELIDEIFEFIPREVI